VVIYALAKVVLWIEIGDHINFRNLLGVRTLPWSTVARFEMNDRDQFPRVDLEGAAVIEWFSRRILGGVAGDSTSVFSRFFLNRGVFSGIIGSRRS